MTQCFFFYYNKCLNYGYMIIIDLNAPVVCIKVMFMQVMFLILCCKFSWYTFLIKRIL